MMAQDQDTKSLDWPVIVYTRAEERPFLSKVDMREIEDR